MSFSAHESPHAHTHMHVSLIMALSIDIDVTFWFGIDDDWLGIGRNLSDLPFDIGVFEADHSTLKNDALVKFILSKFSKDEATEIKTIECRLRKPKMVIVRSKKYEVLSFPTESTKSREEWRKYTDLTLNTRRKRKQPKRLINEPATKRIRK